MKIIDISWPISTAMSQYKDKKRVKIESIGMQEPYVMEHLITLHSHTGTHIDAPAHFLQGGAMIDQLPLERYVGPCYVADLSHAKGAITAEDINAIEPQGVDRVLIKTTNSMLKVTAAFEYNFVYVDALAAQAIVKRGWKLIGIDYLGIERSQPDHKTHILFAQANTLVLEGLRLKQVEQGCYELIALPLALQHVEAAPVRAVLVKRNR